jgi:hypothetical protein
LEKTTTTKAIFIWAIYPDETILKASVESNKIDYLQLIDIAKEKGLITKDCEYKIERKLIFTNEAGEETEVILTEDEASKILI